MATIKKSMGQKDNRGAIFSNEVKDYSEDPFFVEKLEKAKIALGKINFPDKMKNNVPK